jgi:nucleoside-specific outer membrane channel protein Tsx
MIVTMRSMYGLGLGCDVAIGKHQDLGLHIFTLWQVDIVNT